MIRAYENPLPGGVGWIAMKFLKTPLLQPVNAGWQGHNPTACLRGRLSWRRKKMAVLFTTWWIENAELTGGQNTTNTTITTTTFLFAASGLWVLRTTQSDFVRLTWFLMASSLMMNKTKTVSINHYGHIETYLAKGPWNKSLNFIFPTKYVVPKSLKVSHWLSKEMPIGKPTPKPLGFSPPRKFWGLWHPKQTHHFLPFKNPWFFSHH